MYVDFADEEMIAYQESLIEKKKLQSFFFISSRIFPLPIPV